MAKQKQQDTNFSAEIFFRFYISRQTKVFVYSKNRFFPKNAVFLKILCPKIYGTLLKHTGSLMIFISEIINHMM